MEGHRCPSEATTGVGFPGFSGGFDAFFNEIWAGLSGVVNSGGVCVDLRQQ